MTERDKALLAELQRIVAERMREPKVACVCVRCNHACQCLVLWLAAYPPMCDGCICVEWTGE